MQDLQTALNDHGANLAVDGVFGKRTNAAVKDYQASQGLLVDGVVGPDTRGALNGGGGVATGGASAPSASSSSSSTSSIVDTARSALGTPYSWGGSSLGGLDCSGLVNFAYQAAGIDLPRSSSQIANGGTRISQSQAQPGDIVAWPGHVAIYDGNGQVIDASGSKQRVVERGILGQPPASCPTADHHASRWPVPCSGAGHRQCPCGRAHAPGASRGSAGRRGR